MEYQTNCIIFERSVYSNASKARRGRGSATANRIGRSTARSHERGELFSLFIFRSVPGLYDIIQDELDHSAQEAAWQHGAATVCPRLRLRAPRRSFPARPGEMQIFSLPRGSFTGPSRREKHLIWGRHHPPIQPCPCAGPLLPLLGLQATRFSHMPFHIPLPHTSSVNCSQQTFIA